MSSQSGPVSGEVDGKLSNDRYEDGCKYGNINPPSLIYRPTSCIVDPFQVDATLST
ncbi:hypothetical protein [Hahella ganghwensis]|uniref:hypothetical protein n=1 Tax=Hahella ganghwensis TaxID=286420 RepID=UPI00037304E7|nr:hypothetical protein [Hahella ganghwensis]